MTPDNGALTFLKSAGFFARRVSLLSELQTYRHAAALDFAPYTEVICKVLGAAGIEVQRLVAPEEMSAAGKAAFRAGNGGSMLPLVMPFEIPFSIYRWCCALDVPLFSLNDFARCYLTRRDDHRRVTLAFADDASRTLFEQVAFCRMNPMIAPFYLKSFFPDYNHPEVHIAKGDTVFCAGAFEGSTAVGFCEAVQGDCTVIAFEPMPQNCVAARQAIARSPWTERIRLEAAGLHSGKGTLTYHYAGAASFWENAEMVGGAEKLQIPVVDIDSYAREHGLKVDLIQLDVEGAEMEALRGAAATIQRDRPRMQLCIYHKPEHFWDIPLFILEQNQDYDLYLGHHSNGWADTVLYVA